MSPKRSTYTTCIIQHQNLQVTMVWKIIQASEKRGETQDHKERAEEMVTVTRVAHNSQTCNSKIQAQPCGGAIH